MSYLLIDWEKPVINQNNNNQDLDFDLAKFSSEFGKILVFVKKQSEIQQAQDFVEKFRSAKLICVDKNDKISEKMAKKWRKILKKDETAGIVIVSGRKKVAKLLNQSLNDYPDAEIVLLEEFEQEFEQEFENQNNINQENQEIKSEIKPEIKPEIKLANNQNNQNNQEIQEIQEIEINLETVGAALVHLRKMRFKPKKKSLLLKELELGLKLNHSQAHDLFNLLIQNHCVSIDFAENIRYLFK